MIPRIPFVDLRRQYVAYKGEIDTAIAGVVESGSYVGGDAVSQFEAQLANLCGVRNVVTVANGTDAIALALQSLGIGPGDEVITAPNSFIASAGAINEVGATCRFADVDQNLNINPAAVKRQITGKTKAILAVHLTGRPAAMDILKDIADKHDLFLVEDAAQAIGGSLNGVQVGALGDIGCFSLHPLKNIFVMGDGGFITVNCPHLYKKLNRLKNHGLYDRNNTAMWGRNSRLDAIHCAVGLVKLQHFGEITARFIEIANRYMDGLEGLVDLPRAQPNMVVVYHNFVIQTDRRDELMSWLESKGIETKIHYPTLLHLQPAARTLGYTYGDFPVAENIVNKQLSLPIYPEIQDSEVDDIIFAIRSFFDA